MATLLLVLIYILAIGLGIPDSVLGAAWPEMYKGLGVDISLMTCISAITSAGTVTSSLFGARVINRFGIAKVTVVSTVATVLALLGYSVAPSLPFICLLAVPLGLGAGAIDTAINNYMALHYGEMQMNLMHCFYGVGVVISPYLMSLALEMRSWHHGYVLAACAQSVVMVASFIAAPLWNRIISTGAGVEEIRPKTLSILEMARNKAMFLSAAFFFTESIVEAVCISWSSSFLVETKGFAAADAARCIMLYFAGLAIGRLLSGLVSGRISTWKVFSIGMVMLLAGSLTLLFASGAYLLMAALFLVGCGVAPMFPGMVYLTPRNFGEEVSQSVIGFESAAAYSCMFILPITFGTLTRFFSTDLFPYFILGATVLHFFVTASLKKSLKQQKSRP